MESILWGVAVGSRVDCVKMIFVRAILGKGCSDASVSNDRESVRFRSEMEMGCQMVETEDIGIAVNQ